MKVNIVRSHKEYEPIRMLLQIAIAEGDANGEEFIKIVVRDAQGLVRKRVTRYEVDHRLYVYSSEFSHFNRTRLLAMDPDHLRISDLRAMLKFFE